MKNRYSMTYSEYLRTCTDQQLLEKLEFFRGKPGFAQAYGNLMAEIDIRHELKRRQDDSKP